ncbi:monocarboxylate transporter 9-like isoform X2 [Odontomachus brunneus]|uniref:monocarboxylate transporter 9-like isoform X2 n=1 Tax=Odontomachus brunneus TaxID=486640 RepID=UPI0013F22C6D|nr:monocarboxylate transporter 9-like isoform X2 [Odontomachus brunneus]
MDSGNESSLQEIREVDRGGGHHRNGNNNNNKRNGNNNHYDRSAWSQNNFQPQKAPLVGWRNGSPTICPSSVQNSAYAELVKLDPTHEEELIDVITQIDSSERSASNNNREASHVHESQPELETDKPSNERAWDSIDSKSLYKQENDCSIAKEEKERKKPKVPDGGWGWMVVLASLVISMIADGISFSFGLLYIEFLHEFGASKSKTAWIGSLFMAVPLLSGPIMSALVDRYGCRKMTIAGGLISGLGFILSSFANSIEMMYLTFGVIAGLGLGLCYVTAVVSIAYWFDKKRTLAVGLGACGTGIGTFVYAPMTTYFIKEYGWRGTCLLLAGTFFNMIVAGAVMKDPEWWILEQRKHDQTAPKRSHGKSDDTKSEVSPSDEFPGVDELRKLLRSDHVPEYFVQSLNTTTAAAVGGTQGKTCFRSVVNLPTFVKRSEKVPLETLELLLSNSRLYTVILENYPSLLLCRSSSDKQLHDSTGEIPNKSGITMSMRLKRATESRTITEQTKDSHSSPVHVSIKPIRKITRKESEENDPLVTKEVLTVEKPKSALKRNGIGNDAGVIRTDSLPWLRRQFSTNTHYFKDIRVHRNSVMYRGAVLNLRKYRLRASSCPDIYTNSMITLAKENEQKWYDEFVELLKGMLDFSMFAELHFLLLSLSTILLFTWFIIPYFYLAEHLTRNGYDESDGANLLSIIGITNTIGMVALGWAGDQSWMNVSKTYTWCLIACGVATVLMSLFTYHYTFLVASSAAFGLFFASNFSFTPVILVQLIPLERFTTAYGLTLLCQGIGNLLGPPLAGWLFDVTGSWNLSFFMAGGWIIFSGILIGIVPYTKNQKICGNGPVEMERTNGSDSLA